MNSISAINNNVQIGNAELRAAALAESLREKVQAASSAAISPEKSQAGVINGKMPSASNFASGTVLPFDPATVSSSSLENAHKGLDPSRVASLLGLE